MKIKVNRKKWLRGKNSAHMLTYQGKYCILAFIANKKLRIPFYNINIGNNNPIYIALGQKGIETCDYYSINDDLTLKDNQIEKKLTKLAKKDNIDLEFYG